MKTRIRLYVIGLVMILQSFIFYRLSNDVAYTNFIKDILILGLIIIGCVTLVTFILAAQYRAKWKEFFRYLLGLGFIFMLGIGLMLFLVHRSAERRYERIERNGVKVPNEK